MRKGLAVAALLASMAIPASAQQQVSDALTITVVNVTARDTGRTTEDEGSTSLPGDVLEYSLEFTNTQPGPVSNVVLSDPIPQGTVFVLGSVTTSREDVVVEYSTDDAESWSDQPTVEVVENGVTVIRPAPATAYTHVRWTITGEVNPGAQVTARFRTRVAERTTPGGDR